MPDIITFVATSGDYATFGMAEDPAARIVEMQAGNPTPIEVVAGWIVPPQARVLVLDKVRTALRRLRLGPRSDWYEVEADEAMTVLEEAARAHGGRAWKVRKRPRQVATRDNPHHRAVVTPRGQFLSAAAAAAAFGISRQAVWERAQRRAPGWRFADDDSPQPPPPRLGRPPIYQE